MSTNESVDANWHEDLLPHILDRRAQTSPEAIVSEFPKSTRGSLSDGFRQVTYRELANAVNGFAHWLHGTLGKPEGSNVVAYIGPSDIRYPIALLGAIKAGYALLLPSPRNSVEAQLKLFSRTSCTGILSPSPLPAAVSTVLKSDEHLSHYTCPTVDQLLDETHPVYPYTKQYAEAKDDVFCIMHTSGSTGFPKPLVWTHESVVCNLAMTARNAPRGFTLQNDLYLGKRILSMFPPFHGAGIAIFHFYGIGFGSTVISPPVNIIPTGQGLASMLEHTTADAAFVVPSIINEVGQSPALLGQIASRLREKLFVYCGGDLPTAIGNTITSQAALRCLYGASEIGLAPQIIHPDMRSSDWRYVMFQPSMGTTFEPIGDGSFEMVIKRDDALSATQPTFVLFPDQQEYRTRDLFRPHPSIANAWAWCARVDDIIVFLNGEKTNPISFEQHVTASNPGISGAIVVGSQRLQAALLVEPAGWTRPLTPAEEKDLVDQIWPSVQEANHETPAHARVDKSMILITSGDRPILRAGKGTVQRAGTLNMYEADIERLYRENEEVQLVSRNGTSEKALASPEMLTSYLHSLMASSLALENDDLDKEADIFSLGFDSLLTIRLAHTLRNDLLLNSVEPSLVYMNPSVRDLSQSLWKLHLGGSTNDQLSEKKMLEEMNKTLERYKTRIDHLPPLPTASEYSSEAPSTKVVVLTGSTGTVGTYLLHSLLQDPSISKIYCLNRKADAEDVQKTRFATRGLAWPAAPERLVFARVDLSQPNLGLDGSILSEICETATLIIHNAWTVNFNLSLESFKPQLEGLVNLLKISHSTRIRCSFCFISSISTVFGRSASKEGVLEQIFLDPPTSGTTGYAQSKWVGEVLCDYAARQTALKTTVIRIGQVAGSISTEDEWHRTEWFPSLVLSSIQMGLLPDYLGLEMNDLTWIPVDTLSQIIAEVVSSDRTLSDCASVFNLENPSAVPWSDVRDGFLDILTEMTGRDVRLVPAQRWLDRLQEMAVDSTLVGEADHVPALKLLDFFAALMSATSGQFRMNTARAYGASKSMEQLPPVSLTWLRKWAQEWLQKGL